MIQIVNAFGRMHISLLASLMIVSSWEYDSVVACSELVVAGTLARMSTVSRHTVVDWLDTVDPMVAAVCGGMAGTRERRVGTVFPLAGVSGWLGTPVAVLAAP